MSNEEKYRKNMRCLDKWMINRENKKSIYAYLVEVYNVHRIGIYGYGILGKHLVRELQEDGCDVVWVMDKTAPKDCAHFNMIRPTEVDRVENVDMAIITTLGAAEEVEAFLMKHVTGRIISIEELIESIYAWGEQN